MVKIDILLISLTIILDTIILIFLREKMDVCQNLSYKIEIEIF